MTQGDSFTQGAPGSAKGGAVRAPDALISRDETASRRHAVLADAAGRIRFGHWLHLLAGAAHCFGLGFSSGTAAVSFIGLAVMAGLRLPVSWRTYRFLLNDRVGWCLLAWAGAVGVSVLWSSEPSQGLVEWRAFRVVVLPMLMWPIVKHAPLLMLAFLAGVLGQNVAQALQAAGVLEIPLGDGPRLRGMTHPVLTGTLCVLAMCLYGSAALTNRNWWRWLSVIGFLLTGLGLVYTGSRGPWLAAAMTMPVMVIVIAWRYPGARKMALVAAIGAVAAAAASWPFVHEIIEYRLRMTETDVELVEQGTYTRDVGHRLACWAAAWEAFEQEPIGGVGAGGFLESARHSSYAKSLSSAEHAHSLFMHTLATNGAVGFAAMLVAMLGALVRAWRSPWDHPFAAGVFFALLGWLLCGLFDSVQLSGQMLGVCVLLVTVTLPRPPASGWLRRSA